MLNYAMKRDRNNQSDIRNTWLMPLRLIIFLVVFGSIVASLRTHLELYAPLFVYSLVTLLFLVSLLLGRRSVFHRGMILLQLVTELYIEAVIVYYSGCVSSPYAGLFVLTIVSASLVYRLVGTLLIATVASAAYFITIWLGTGTDLRSALDIRVLASVYLTDDETSFTVFVHLCVFFLTAFISGYLADRVRAKDRELLAASENLERARLETDEIVRYLHSGLITVNNHGKIVCFNRAAERITGFSESRIKGRNCLDVFRSEMPEFAEKILSALKSSQHDIRSEITIRRKDGDCIPVGISTSMLGDDRYGVRGVVAVFHDLTKAKEIEERMRRADRLAAVGELAAGIAHEIRNPLAAISGSVEVLIHELECEGENGRLMSLIMKESGRLNNILGEFLDYTRVKRPSFSKVEINHLILGAFEIVRHNQSYHQGIKLEHKARKTTEYISGDEEMFTQFLLNLLANAVEAIGTDNGTVVVGVDDYDDQPEIAYSMSNLEWIRLTVSDTGPGMTEEQEMKLFEPFFSTKKDGTGLGLSIVRRIVENLGGSIEVESRLNGGTCITVYLRRYIEGLPKLSARDDTASGPVALARSGEFSSQVL